MPPILLGGEGEGAGGFAVDGGEGFADGVADLIAQEEWSGFSGKDRMSIGFGGKGIP